MAIHPTAIVDSKAELGDGVEVGPFCVVERHVRVGAGCRLYHGVYLTGWTEIGQECTLHPGVIVGHEPQDTKYGGERSYCRVGRRTILREYVTIHRGTVPESETTVGDDCFLLAGAHVGHNCRIGDRVTLINNVLLGGYVEVGAGANLGGSVGVHQFVRIGELAMVAGRARVTRDVVPFALVDADGRVAGLNRVGLRRAEVPRPHAEDIRNLYRILFRRGVSLPEAIERVAAESSTPAGARLVRFLQAESRRGIAGRSRRGSQAPDSDGERESA